MAEKKPHKSKEVQEPIVDKMSELIHSLTTNLVGGKHCSTMKPKSDSRLCFLFGAVVTTLVILGSRTVLISLSSSMQDFTYYRLAAQNLLRGADPYLTYPTQVYPPSSLFLFIPFSLLPSSLANSLWLATSLISLFISTRIFCRYAFKKSHLSLVLVIFLLALQTFPVKYALAQGQINFLVYLCFALLFHFLITKRYSLAGLVLSFAVILKFNPILLLLYLIITEKTKPLPVFFLSFITLNLLIDLIFPSPLNTSFLQTMLNMSTHYSGYYFNTSLSALSIRLFDQPTAQVFNLFLSVLIWIITLLVSQKTKHNLTTFSLFLVAILLTSPITWQHYLFWTIPAFLLLCGPLSRSRLLLKQPAYIPGGRYPSSGRFRKAKMPGPPDGGFLPRSRPSLALAKLRRRFLKRIRPEGKKQRKCVDVRLARRGGLASILIIFISFILINMNLKNPRQFSTQSLIYSHATFGLLLLWTLLIRKQKRVRRHPQ